MSRLASVFRSDRAVLITYVTVGYPRLESTLEIVPALAEAGCDVVELGIPFSDPLADGATIQASSQTALRQGVTTNCCLEIATQLRQKVSIPLLFMSYYNPVLKFGVEGFCRESARAGIDGFIIPDLPPEEGVELETSCSRHRLDLVYFLAPTSTEERIELVASRARGFIYLVALTGVTGARQSLPPELEGFVARVRCKASQPLCLGFGIATPEQARRAARVADGVIIGSKLIDLLSGDNPLPQATSFIREVRQALDG